jgi:hypothetical protein
VNSELNEFSKRLALLVDNLLADLAERHREFDSHSSRSKGACRDGIVRCIKMIRIGKDTLKAHQQQIAAEIHRARTAVSNPLRREWIHLPLMDICQYHNSPLTFCSSRSDTSNKSVGALESDLQYVLIQQTEDVLQTDLQAFQKVLLSPMTMFNSLIACLESDQSNHIQRLRSETSSNNCE